MAAEAKLADNALQQLTELGARLWTQDEGATLGRLRGNLSLLRTAVADHGSSVVAALPLLAALLPAFWMIGHAEEGYELAKRICSSHLLDDLCVTRITVAQDQADFRFPLQSEPAPAATVAEPAFLRDVPKTLLLACCMDGGGQNAYACTRYDEAARFHASALHLVAVFERGGEASEGSKGSAGGAAGSASSSVHVSGGEAFALDAALLRSRALDGLGRVARESGNYDRSLALHAAAARAAVGLETRAAAEQTPFRFRPEPRTCVANAVSNAGVAAYRQGNFQLAQRCHEEAYRLRSALSDLRGTSSTLGNLALLTADASDALKLYEESLHIRERLGDTWGVAGSHRAIASMLLKRREPGDDAKCALHLKRALPIFASVKDSLGVAECLESLGLLLAKPTATVAAKLLGCAVGVRNASGAATDVVTAHAEAAALRATYTEEWQQGEKLSLAEALVFAEASSVFIANE